MSERQYCPDIWLDEIVAVSVRYPSACIVGVDGKWLITDDEWRETDGKDGQSVELTPGEIVKFGYSEPRGRVTVIKHDDGSFSGGGTIPTDATSWWEVGEADTLSDSLEELVRDHMYAGETVEAEAYRWEFDVPFVFEVDGDVAKFVPCVSS